MLDCRRERTYTQAEWDQIIVLHVAAHPDVKPEDCAGCKQLAKRRNRVQQ